jgi:hypothetical protein
MMVHKSRQSDPNVTAQARTSDGITCSSGAEDFQLFDGQQRLTTLLLGYRHGQLDQKLRLWVDLGVDPPPSSGLLFQLRISSSGQPFGYQQADPNQKPSLGQRRTRIEEWKQRFGLDNFDPRSSFQSAAGQDLIGGICPFPLHEAITELLASNLEEARNNLIRKYVEVPENRLDTFLVALQRALNQTILFQLIDEAVLSEESEYIRFFDRLGRGGTALSQDELTYSIIKHQYPEVHDRMTEIMDGNAGRLASEVNLVLGSIRVAKVLSGWSSNNVWDVISRPNPSFVSQLKKLPEVETAFRELIPITKGGRLVTLLNSIRQRLIYDPEKNPSGLPVILLARMPHQLVDVLLLVATQPEHNEPQDPLPAFTLYWLLFVSDSEKAASQIFRQFFDSRPTSLSGNISSWIDQFERDGIAHSVPLQSQLTSFLKEAQDGDHILRAWSERFTVLDTNEQHATGNTLRVLSTHREIIKRTLLWLQRKELSTSYQHFDPTSAEDEDLPIDLDHLIPSSIFGFHWKSRDSFINFDDPHENFRHHRGLVGNSLGNFRWLDASDNRSRGNGIIEPDFDHRGVDHHEALWNHLIEKKPWDHKEASAFQRLVDTRTIDLFSILLEESGISLLRAAPVIGKP